MILTRALRYAETRHVKSLTTFQHMPHFPYSLEIKGSNSTGCSRQIWQLIVNLSFGMSAPWHPTAQCLQSLPCPVLLVHNVQRLLGRLMPTTYWCCPVPGAYGPWGAPGVQCPSIWWSMFSVLVFQWCMCSGPVSTEFNIYWKVPQTDLLVFGTIS